MSREKLYLLLLTACTGGYLWLALSWSHAGSGDHIETACLFKRVTGLPCPSCGVTRSVIALLQGNPEQSVACNPLGLPVLLILLSAPLWIACDLLNRKQTLLNCYLRIELLLRQKRYAIPAILLVAANWGWNIYKRI